MLERPCAKAAHASLGADLCRPRVCVRGSHGKAVVLEEVRVRSPPHGVHEARLVAQDHAELLAARAGDKAMLRVTETGQPRP